MRDGNGTFIHIGMMNGVKWSCAFFFFVSLSDFSSIPQVESGYVAEADHKTMAKAIKDRVSLIRRKREQRQLVREEQEKRKLEAEQQQQQQQQQQHDTHKASHTQVCRADGHRISLVSKLKSTLISLLNQQTDFGAV